MPLFGEFSALLTAVCWSGSAIVFGLATSRLSSVLVNITRLVLAVVYLLLLILIAGLSLALSTQQYTFLALSGIVGLTLGDSFLFRSYQLIGPRLTMLVMSIAPAITAVLAYVFLGESLSAAGIIGITVTLCGISVVVLERGNNTSSYGRPSVAGLGLAFLAATGQAVGLIFAKLAFNTGPVNGFVATVIRIVASLSLLIPGAYFTGRLTKPIHALKAERRAFSFLLLGSVLGPFLGISLSLIAVGNTSVAIAATIMATVPILMLPLVRFVYKERLSPKAIAGAFIAVGGVAVLFLR